MTDIELLPLPELPVAVERFIVSSLGPMKREGAVTALRTMLREYARANVLHHTAAQAAEIERLRAEREVIVAEAMKYADKSGRLEAKVGRLEETLQLARDLVEDWAGYAGEYFQKKHNLEGDLALLDAALRDHEQEVGNE